MPPWRGVIREFREFLPPTEEESIVTLLEGGTPLIRSVRLRDWINREIELYLKYEGCNPTGSFKDRGMTLAVSQALREGITAVICASTGNTSASASAYAARAGLRAFVLIPEGQIALGKLSQAIMHGAEVLQVQGNFDEALAIVKEVARGYPVALVNSINPYRLEGQQTAAFEICDQLGDAPTYQSLPVGNAGNITAYWKGYRRYREAGRTSGLPILLGFQAEGAAPIVRGHVVEHPETVATAIRIGNPASWQQAVAARDESGGVIDMVSDDQILEAYQLIAGLEGIFCEPASASSVAGVIKLNKAGRFRRGDRIVCTLTGNGLKDLDCALRVSRRPATISPTTEAVLKHLRF
ncbi:MAG: threonine synthase [Deltaproteobacteria bacterium]|nr:threonine synthase [Deltaproteobacteria bacterium]MBI3077397.1 threonine synthase [Deltaproteobacteria bacterium]